MKVGRFQVMALLQAARAHRLGLPLESAYSWGLNRAIFIAAAKRGFKGTPRPTDEPKRSKPPSREAQGVYILGDDMAYKADTKGKLLFTFGGKVQTNEEFEKRVKSRFGTRFAEAWKKSMDYVATFDEGTLLSAEAFFRDVYKPVRDEWAEAWTDEAAE